MFSFLKCQGSFFESCLYSKLVNENVFELIDRTPFNWPAGKTIFCPFFFSFRQKNSWSSWTFLKQIRHSLLTTAFLSFDPRFLQKLFQDPVAFSLAALTGAKIFGGRKFLPTSFWPIYLKNQFFSDRKKYSVALI